MEPSDCIVDTSKLRGSNNVMKTEGLFLEMRAKATKNPARSYPEPVYTLKDYDHKGYPSMYLEYMKCSTEYEAAMKLLGSWKHWKKLTTCNFFAPYIEEWREERHLREEALAKTALLDSLGDGNVSAAKTILDERKKRSAGRPSNEAVQGEIVRSAKEQTNLASIVERMRSV